MSEPEVTDESPLMCHRCGIELEPGKGDFYVVKIKALADPTPPSFSEEDLYRDARVEIERLIEQMEGLSEQEAMDQIYRRLVLYLCGRCYETAKSRHLFRDFVDATPQITLTENEIQVQFQKRAHNPLLLAPNIDKTACVVPWLGKKRLRLIFG